MFWAGWTDEDNYFFTDVNTRNMSLLEDGGFWPFYPGEPNGEYVENCAVVWPAKNAWNDYMCSLRTLGFCHIPTRPRYKLRGKENTKIINITLFTGYVIYFCVYLGITLDIKFDDRYTMNTDYVTNGHYTFDGYTNTRIYYNNGSELWHMVRIFDPAIYATTASPGDYPFGTHLWDIVSETFTGKAALNLNACFNADQYNCFDGTCININARSNHLIVKT
jgi:hypothetical protein